MARPVLDNHCHLNPESGQGLEAVKAFTRSGGTHLLVVNQPSWKLGVTIDSGKDFREVYERTIDITNEAAAILPGTAWPVLGVHPALISRLTDEGFDPQEAGSVMTAGLEVAAEYAADGRAIALKSGRPHYDVPQAIRETSNGVLQRALELGADTGVAVQLHTESATVFSDIRQWGETVGLPAERIVKHYAGGPLDGIIPSVISRQDPLLAAAQHEHLFLMETDFLDDPDRPGAVLGLRTVPRRTKWLEDRVGETAVRIAHIETPRRVYGIDTTATL